MILLDTHVLIWATADPGKLSRAASDTIHRASEQGGLAICCITLWELGWLATHRHLDIAGTVESFLEEVTSRVSVRSITVKIATVANQLPADFPTDPCDRLIGATALAEGIPLVTKDANIRRCKQIKTIW